MDVRVAGTAMVLRCVAMNQTIANFSKDARDVKDSRDAKNP